MLFDTSYEPYTRWCQIPVWNRSKDCSRLLSVRAATRIIAKGHPNRTLATWTSSDGQSGREYIHGCVSTHTICACTCAINQKVPGLCYNSKRPFFGASRGALRPAPAPASQAYPAPNPGGLRSRSQLKQGSGQPTLPIATTYCMAASVSL